MTNMGDAQSAATTLRWKKEVDGTTTEIGTSALSALTRLQGGFKTIRLTAPSTPGTSSYWACVDSVADESDATNNCSGRVTVTVTQQPRHWSADDHWNGPGEPDLDGKHVRYLRFRWLGQCQLRLPVAG